MTWGVVGVVTGAWVGVRWSGRLGFGSGWLVGGWGWGKLRPGDAWRSSPLAANSPEGAILRDASNEVLEQVQPPGATPNTN